MARHKDANWNLPGPRVESWTQASVAVLMDIRDELKSLNANMRELNSTLSCYRVRRMSDDINRIDRRMREHMPLAKGRKK